MAVDPMALVNMVRPGPAEQASAFTPVPGAMRRRRDTMIETPTGDRSASELSGAPGTINFKLGVGNPPCAVCASDHNPIKERLNEYDHTYVHPDAVPGGGLIVMSPGGPPPAVDTPAASVPLSSPPVSQRVSIIPGRGEDTFIVAIECAPEWDLVDSWKLTTEQLLPMLPILRQLSVKIRDNTAGELAALAVEHGVR